MTMTVPALSGLLDGLLGLASPWGYLLIGMLAGLEAAAFVGLVIPGETAMLLGGVLVASGRAELGVMMAAASLGAVLGDSLGYEIGRHFGGPLRRTRVGRRIGEERWRRAEDYVRRRGGRAVFLGRFVGVLRALVPAVAGAARMPYRTFLPYNLAGGVVWASGFVFAGYLAGSSYQRVASLAGRAGLLLAVVVVVGGVIALAARWVARHPERAAQPLRRVWLWPPFQRLASRYAVQVAFLAERLRPGATLGLLLTAQLAMLIFVGTAFGAVLEDVVRQEEIISIDQPVARFMLAHREPWLTRAFEITTWAGSTAVLVPALAIVGLCLRRVMRTWWPLLFLAASLVGATALSNLIKLAVGRPRPDGVALVEALGYAFPSGHATAAAAGWLSVAIVLGGLIASWARKVALVTAAFLIAGVVGLSRVYLGVHEPTDVLGGWALGAFWVAVILVTTRVLAHSQDSEHPNAPQGSHAPKMS